jgi:hypothetical protein
VEAAIEELLAEGLPDPERLAELGAGMVFSMKSLPGLNAKIIGMKDSVWGGEVWRRLGAQAWNAAAARRR